MRRTAVASAAWLFVAVSAAAQTTLDDHKVDPFRPGADKASAIFLIASDCPISNAYAPTIAAVCRDYATKGVSCTLAYEDSHIDATAVRKHAAEYNLTGIPTTIDATRRLADRAHAEITPTAIVVDGHGAIRYQGQIDNLYINIGRTRQQVTEHYLTDALDAVIAGKTVKQPKADALGCYIER